MTEVVAGIDIGGTNTVFGLVDHHGNIHAGGSLKTTGYNDISGFVSRLYNTIKAEEQKDVNLRISGFGIGAPMAAMKKGTIEYAAGLPWKGVVPIAEIFRKHTELPVIITNDANAAAIGEMIYGGARGMKDFAVITLGTGLGSGIVVNGRLLDGYDGFAGELGHTVITSVFPRRNCGCGRQGCLETYVSATGLKRTLFSLMADSSEAGEFSKIAYNDISASMICDAALGGNALAIEAFSQTGYILGKSLADLVAVTNPEAIFLFGGLASAGKLIFEPARESMEANLLNIYRGRVKLLPSGLDTGNAAVLGAASLVFADQEIK